MGIINRIKGRIASAVPGNLAVRLDSGPLCSFTFDDCHRTSALVGGQLLESVGASGTYFVASSMLDEGQVSGMLHPEDISLLLSKGHEVACHTYSHKAVSTLDDRSLVDEFARNERSLAQLGGPDRLVTFSYPFGEVSLRAKRLVGRRFAAGRGVREGLNLGILDMAELRACRIFHPEYSARKIRDLVRKCKRQSAWLIFYTHDIVDNPSRWGCTPDEFSQVLAEVMDAGIAIETIRGAVGRTMFRAE